MEQGIDVCAVDLLACRDKALVNLQLTREGGSGPQLIKALSDLGFAEYLLGNNEKALGCYLEAQERAESEDENLRGLIHLRIANFWRAQGRMDSARNHFSRCQPESLNAETRSFYDQSLGWLCYQTGHFSQALKLGRKILSRGDSRDARSLITLAWYQLSRPDSASFYLSENLAIANRDSVYDRLDIFDITTAGDIAFFSGRYLDATKEYARAYRASKKHGFDRLLARTGFRLGRVYEVFGNWPEALQYYYESKILYSNFHAYEEVARVNSRIAWVFVYSGNIPYAIKFANESTRQLRELGDSIGLAADWNLLGYIQFRLDSLERASRFYDSALAFRKTFENPTDYHNTIFNQAEVHRVKQEYRRALELQLAIEKNEVRDNTPPDNRLFTVIAIAELYRLLKDRTNAERYYLKAIQESQKFGLIRHLRDASRLLLLFYASSGEREKGLKHFVAFTELDDSLRRLEDREILARLSLLQEFKMKERETEALRKENELAAVRSEMTTRKYSSLLLFVILLGVTLVVLAVYIRSRLKMIRRVNDMNALLQDKNAEIRMQSEKLAVTNRSLATFNSELEGLVSERTAKLKKANHDLETYFYRASHDLRGPVSTLLGLVDVAVKEEFSQDKVRTIFEMLNKVALKQQHLIDKLQQLHHVLNHDHPKEEVNISLLTSKVVREMTAKFPGAGMNVAFDIVEEHAFTSRSLLEAILGNLVENAFVFKKVQQSNLRISATSAENAMVITIEDDGEGISDEISKSVFGMFFRGSSRSIGNGLGLYIVSRAAESIQASVSFTSVAFERTIFTVIVPNLNETKRARSGPSAVFVR